MSDFFLNWATAIPLVIAVGVLIIMIIIELRGAK
jgi:hypothetical protein